MAAPVHPRAGESVLPLVPKPMEMTVGEGHFTLNRNTIIQYGMGTLPEAEYLVEEISPATGFPLSIQRESGDESANTVTLRLDPSDRDLGDEGYRLEVTAEGVLIVGHRPAGVFYGIQTMRQLLPTEIFSKETVADVEWIIPIVSIRDKPRFEWRGQLLDVCRHFFDADTVKRTIDHLALHKMNRLHWHLTEDQGWRIEIKRYPLLTEIGAWRDDGEGGRYGGYYTQDEIREIVAYAARRHITVVPEIEMPGHAMGALASYPELGCTGGPYEVATTWGIFEDVYCAGNDAVLDFNRNVLDEVLHLFPSRYIHIGGDECPKTRWRECERCQGRIEAEGLADEDELQSWFVTQMSKYLDERGRRLVGWDEILEGGLAPGAVVQSWRGMSGGIAAAELGHDVIMSPTSHCYLDYSYTTISLERAYSLEPIPDELLPDRAHHVLGVEGNMWTEFVPDRDRLDHQVYPRLTALAEVAWSPRQARDWPDFLTRMDTHIRRYEILGIQYAREFKGLNLEGAMTFDQWTPDMMSEEGRTLEWDLGDQVDGPGAYEFIF
ncbi:MAG: beta-N-acetylhexosaminidase, partial [Candidatus Sumerlaeia bacterium]|nr:beta-N-acetylhexosaminidase [Candidatus Sumerlaeia bacterium]